MLIASRAPMKGHALKHPVPAWNEFCTIIGPRLVSGWANPDGDESLQLETIEKKREVDRKQYSDRDWTFWRGQR
jgi:hypothetical protein